MKKRLHLNKIKERTFLSLPCLLSGPGQSDYIYYPARDNQQNADYSYLFGCSGPVAQGWAPDTY